MLPLPYAELYLSRAHSTVLRKNCFSAKSTQESNVSFFLKIHSHVESFYLFALQMNNILQLTSLVKCNLESRTASGWNY